MASIFRRPSLGMADAVTIALLPVPLALVHIPRSRLQSLSHPVLRHILNPSPVFFTVTANEIELSLFVDYEHVEDFEIIASKDRHDMRKDPVEISHEPWNVLQIDSHSDQLDNAGARVNELSAPLAAAGISILYQSSYMSDFILVKQSRLHEALVLFRSAGFDLYTSNTSSTPTMSPISLSSPSGGCSSTASSPTVLTRGQFSFPPSSIQASTPTSCAMPQGRTKSHSPTAGEVHILSPDLACVGLSDEFGVDHWGLKIVKLVAFPELIPSSPSSSSPPSSFLSSTASASRLREGSYIPFSPTQRKSRESRKSEDETDDDGYFSHSPRSISTTELGNAPEQIAVEPTSSSANHREIRTRNFGGEGGMGLLSPINMRTSGVTTATPAREELREPKEAEEGEEGQEVTLSPPLAHPSLRIPFFSFTRTQEGSSLTADVKTLAALFPPEERHLLVCCSDLDLDSCSDDDEGCESGSDNGVDGEEGVGEPGFDDGCDVSIGELKCLQIDLRGFGLDKYGLVNRFSKVLGKNGVNHMYSSTFKTANLLVNKRHALRAQALLRGC